MHDVYFFTDVHGEYNLFKTIMNWCKQQDPDCTIIYGGDAADRGDNGYQIIKELLDDEQVIYLYGNHEDLFIKAADAIVGFYSKDDESYKKLQSCKTTDDVQDIIMAIIHPDVSLHLQNGGFATLRDWLLDHANEEIIDRLRDLPRVWQYENIDFCHAGGGHAAFEQELKYQLNLGNKDYNAERNIIWDRDCLPLGWKNGRICVFGHTPTIYLPAGIYGRDKSQSHIHPCAWTDKMGAKSKRNGWKIDMDTGMTWTKRAYVLNCLTMKVQGFHNPHQFNNTLPDYIALMEPYKII